MTKNFILICLLLPTLLIGQTSLQKTVNTFSNYWAFKNASISITIKDLKDGSTLAAHNSELALPPASITKLFSTASAFEILGPQYKPKTELYMDGKINANGIVQGDVYLRALGDPSNGSRYFTEEGKEDDYLQNWIKDIQNAGIKEIQGKLIVDGSAFGYQGCPEGWTWGDIGNYYGAGPNAIVVNDNILTYYFKTSSAGVRAELLRTVPNIPGLRLLNTINGTNVSSDNSIIYGAPYSLDLYASGELPSGRSKFKVKGVLPDPERFLAEKLHSALTESGIKVKDGFDYNRNRELNQIAKKDYKSMTLIQQWEGQTLEQIALYTNMKSVNLFAEQLVCLIGYEKKGLGSTANGIDYIESYWKGKLHFDNFNMKDGSGLSRSNAISSQQFAELLTYMSKSKQYEVFRSTLPVAGKSGTLTNVCRGAAGEGCIIAKSGTMSKIKAYAGYVKTKSGKDLCFAMIVNNYNCSNAATLDQMEKIMNEMANY